MLKCTGCDERFLEKEGLEETPRGICIADNVCPSCNENLVTMNEITVTEFITEKLRSLPYEQWDEIPAIAIAWNRAAYRLPDAAVLSMFETLKQAQKWANDNGV